MASRRANVPRRAGCHLAWCVAALLGGVAPASAQIAAPASPGPYVIDVRAATAGIPQAAAFYPAFPAGTIVPTRGFGLDLGGHVYAGRLGPARLGLGVSFVQSRGTASTAPTTATTATTTTTGSGTAADATAVVYPDVTSSVRLVAPQMSFNFGTAAGWSYLSAGLTLARVKVEGSAVSAGSTPLSHDSGNATGFNAGGGARWFVNRHFGVGFDIRFHRAGSVRMFAAGAGVAVK
jgi:opacity protein-like surface antigen